MADVTLKGLTTIKWGTSSIVGSPFATAIVESISASDPNATPVYVQNNDGLDAAAILLTNGYDFTFTVVYDSAISWPTTKGTAITLNMPGLGSKAGFLTSIEPTAQRAREETIQVRVSFREKITP